MLGKVFAKSALFNIETQINMRNHTKLHGGNPQMKTDERAGLQADN